MHDWRDVKSLSVKGWKVHLAVVSANILIKRYEEALAGGWKAKLRDIRRRALRANNTIVPMRL